MIKDISIKGFKSIKSANLDCGRINVFIGEPNCGKTNVLEGIGLLGLKYTKRVDNIVRYEDFSNLFYDNNISQNVVIAFTIDGFDELSNKKLFRNTVLDITNKDSMYTISYNDDFNTEYSFKFVYDGNKYFGSLGSSELLPVKYYEFKKFKVYEGKELNFLYPPNGKNLFNILSTNPELRKYASDLFENYGYFLQLYPTSKKIGLSRLQDGVLISQPFYNVADTLQRVLFYTSIIDSNTDSTILLDEPDVYLFPKYTKHLAERIAKYNTNQFFFTTHNPYFLQTLAEKTPEKDLRIFLTYYEDYQTKFKLLNSDEVLSLRDEDTCIFFNLDKFR
jgi:hypothetical protein